MIFLSILLLFSYLMWKESRYQGDLHRLNACGLDRYIEPEELQDALNFENKRAQTLDAVNRKQMQIHAYWLDRGRQMGVVK